MVEDQHPDWHSEARLGCGSITTMPEETNQKSAQNYELLIRVDEQLKNLTREVRDMHSSVDQRVALLEETRLTKEDAAAKFSEMKKAIDSHGTDIEDLKTEATKIKTAIKTWGTIIAVLLTLVEIVLNAFKG